ncbi:MAG: hypothetical protein ACRD5G_04590 [Candidatus Acidiferrales bacterium]
MDSRFANLPFADAGRASANLALIERRLPAKLWQALPTLLAQAPDADGALNYLERYLRDDGRDTLDRALRYIERNPATLHYLLLVFSYSRFLSETLVQQPELAEWLHRPSRTRNFRGGIERVKSDEDLEEEFARFEATALTVETAASEPLRSTGAEPEWRPEGRRYTPSRVLARFKRREYLRIMLRDVLGLATLADTTYEISQLADVLLRRALRISEQRLESAYGAPQFTDEAGRTQRAAITILSLGKLGAQELNYASDIDLIFLYDREGETSGGTQIGAQAGKPVPRDGESSGGADGVITNQEYFIRLTHAVMKLISEPTPEGAVFRVDLRLRPQGAEGFVAMSIPAALHYYRTRAREWELQMLIKARPSAGDVEAGRRFLRELHPLVFRPEFNLGAVEAVLNAREEMTRSLARRRSGLGGRHKAAPTLAEADHGVTWNVKLSPGGIRDIEFLTQCLQRVYGGADPWLASPAAASTLVALQRLHDKGHLSGRDFFRLSSAYQFLRRVEHRLQLRDGLQRHTLPGRDATPPGALERLARRCGIEAPPGQAADALLARIGQHFAEVREVYQRLILPHRAAEPAMAPAEDSPLHAGGLLRRVARQYPRAAQAAQESAAGGNAFARRGLDRYLTAALLDPATMRKIEEHPGWLARAAELFSRSDFAVEKLARHVRDIDLLAEGADARVTTEGEAAREAAQQSLADIRTSYRRRLLRALIRSALGEAKPFETFASLTAHADWALAAALPFARAPIEGSAVELAEAQFVILGLGRLGSSEMDFASDADLVFVTGDELTPERREPWRRVAELFIHVVSSQTQEGALFPVDTRLRPGGAAGDIVVSAARLREYLGSGQAQAWEAVTWLKARPVAGNLTFGDDVLRGMRAALAERWREPAVRAQMMDELAALRVRMEREGTGVKARGEFKHLPGGFYDIDYIVSLAALRAGARHSEAQASGDILAQIEALRATHALDASAAQKLHSAAALFRATDHAHRVVTGHAANRPPEPALAQRMVALLVAWQVLSLGADVAAFQRALQTARRQVRSLYQKAFSNPITAPLSTPKNP